MDKTFDDVIYWLWLTIAFGPANPRKWEVLSGYDSVCDFYEDVKKGVFPRGLTDREISSIKSADIQKAEQTAAYCEKKGIKIYCADDDDFPQILKEISNPPSVLFCMGDLSFLNEKIIISVVGARDISSYSLAAEKKLVGELIDCGIRAASGFAVGADSAANEISIAKGAESAAVLAGGLEYDYPKGTSSLKYEIAQNGAVISEFFPNHRPKSADFTARNRILAGICQGVFVIEAGEKSGALSTASFALGQGKDIFTLTPHNLFNSRYNGQITLLRDGAIPVFTKEDILNEYKNNYSHRLTFKHDGFVSIERRFEKSRLGTKNKTEKSGGFKAEADRQPDLSGMSPLQRSICESLKNGAKSADAIAEELSLDISELLTELTGLEISGAVKSLAGGRYSL